MGSYTNMSAYYDVIMTSGYYDYSRIVDNLVESKVPSNVLEIGCGTGLIIEELAKRQPQTRITGIDLTPEMIDIAQKRLEPFDNVCLSQQNVCTLNLQQEHDLAFSYGGVWYFVVDGDSAPFMVSHIPDDHANAKGLEMISQCIASGGKLLLGIQGPHHNYAKPISNGMIYSQEIEPLNDGFVKHYYLDDGQNRVMSQTIRYKTYSWNEACEMLAQVGLHPIMQAHPNGNSALFIGFNKV
jgi:SAM-dependent methyltransferase